NKLIVSPNGSDLTNELIEVRGPANEVIPTDLWLLVIEGDANASNYGRVAEEIQLGDGTRTFGANGIFAIVCNYTDENTSVVTTNPYSALMNPDATVLEIELTGNDVTGGSSSNVSSQTPDIGYDGNFSDATGSYMLIQGSDPDNVYIDGPNAGDALAFDGNIDATGPQTSWILYDSVAYMDDDIEGGGPERAYAQIVFAQDQATNGADQTATDGANVIDFPFGDPHIIIRQGTNTGFTIDDWAIADTDESSPDWEFKSDAALPDAFQDWDGINTVYGTLNPTASALSIDESDLQSSLSVYPNPAETILFVNTSNQTKIDSIDVYNILGKRILNVNNLVDDSINVSEMTSGLYLLKIKSGNSSVTKRLIIK
ncbi:MAG: T9SS type A sorting domain-containing protein, partial [Bacteroidota bacterium]